MKHNLTTIFQKAKYEPSTDLAENIWQTIMRRNKRQIQFRLWAFACLGIASLGGLVPVFKMLLGDLTQSGFYEYFSLIFSDGGSIVSYWKELVLSLAESLPVMSIIFALSLVFVFFLSMRFLMKQINRDHLILAAN